MRVIGIAEVLRGQVPGAELPESSAENPRKWLRFPCPFCGKDRAAINYGLNIFTCYHVDCRVTLSTRPAYADPAGYLADRFRFQIDQAIRNTRTKYGDWAGDLALRVEAGACVKDHRTGVVGMVVAVDGMGGV